MVGGPLRRVAPHETGMHQERNRSAEPRVGEATLAEQAHGSFRNPRGAALKRNLGWMRPFLPGEPEGRQSQGNEHAHRPTGNFNRAAQDDGFHEATNDTNGSASSGKEAHCA
jgi:hypothetical protein